MYGSGPDLPGGTVKDAGEGLVRGRVYRTFFFSLDQPADGLIAQPLLQLGHPLGKTSGRTASYLVFILQAGILSLDDTGFSL